MASSLTWMLFVGVCIAMATTQEPEHCYAPDYTNDLLNVTMTEQRLAFENSSWCSPSGPCRHSCCPVIVRPSCWVPRNIASVIESYSACRANAAIITDRGGCQDKGDFFWWVSWGDGTKSVGYRDVLGPYQEVHTYSSCYRSYFVVAAYCSKPVVSGQIPCCDYYGRRIDVHP
jgi:hypothetical protein